MATRDPYDRERVVREHDIHDQPTQAIRQTEVVQDAHAPVAHHREVAYVEPAGYATESVREDVAFDRVLERRATLARIASTVWFVAGLLMAALGLRVVFRLLEANEASGFVNFVYGFTEPFVRPFQGIFADPAADGAVLDSAALTAMVIYTLATWAIVRLIWLLFDRPETGVTRSVHARHHEHV